MRRLTGRAAVSLAIGLHAAGAHAELGLNMPRGVTVISRQIFDLHMLILWICVIIGTLVFGFMFYSVFRYRKSRGAKAAQFHDNTAVEILWTVIPALILVAMAVPATKTLLAIEDTSDSDLTIQITGYQWRWRYDYLGEGVGFFSNTTTPQAQIENQEPKGPNYLLEVDHPLVLPVGRKVRLLTTSNDVIHAWWAPQLGVKRDAIPGFINESWTRIDTPGTYRGQCVELCGVNHGFMPIVVVAKPQAEYEEWLGLQKRARDEAAAAASETWSQARLMEHGAQVYATACAACHQSNGEGIPGAFPALRNSAVAQGPIAAHLRLVMDGVAGTAMQAFGPQLSDSDIAAVITYERNSWGNSAGDALQPTVVGAARSAN